MPGELAWRQVRIGRTKGLQHFRQDRVLLVIVRRHVLAFELDTDREVVAARTAAKKRCSRVPRSFSKRHELHQLTVAPDKQMRGYFHTADFAKVWMRIPIKLIQEQVLDFGAAKLAGWQANAVEDNRIQSDIGRSFVAIGAQTQSGGRNQSVDRIDGIVASHDHLRHDFEHMGNRLLVSGAVINGAEWELEGDRARYLGKVLRSRVGDRLTVFNAEGPEWPATIVRIGKNSVALQLDDSIEAGTESPLKIHLVQGISRGDRMDLVVQKATELGVKRITPVLTEYGVVKLNAERAEKRREHWQKIANSACEQSGRTRLPLIDTPLPLKNWFGEKPAKVDAELILTPGAATPLAGMDAPQTKVCVLIGPEGGFSDIEHEDAAVSRFTSVSLGPRVLRTESAAIATLAVLQSLWGDLR